MSIGKRKQKKFTNEEKEFADNLKSYRKDKHLTQEQLAEKIDRSPTSISEYETLSKEPGIFTVKKIANALGVSIDMLCGNTPEIQYKKEMEIFFTNTLLIVLEQLKSNVHVDENKITLTISKENDNPNYSSYHILNFFKEYEIIQTFENSIATKDMIKTLKDNLKNKYKHLPELPPYSKISAE